MMRNQLAAHYSWSDVGIWQGVSSRLDAYLQFITPPFQRLPVTHASRLTENRTLRVKW